MAADQEVRADGIIASQRGARRVVVGGPRVPMLRERRLTTDLAGTPVEWSDDRYLGGAAAIVRQSRLRHYAATA